MRKASIVLLFVVGIVLVAVQSAAAAQQTTAGTSGGLTGKWTVKADFYGRRSIFSWNSRTKAESSQASLGETSWRGPSREMRCILWPRTNTAGLRNARRRELLGRSYEEMRAITLEFLDTDVFNVSPEHCTSFLNPLIDSWDINLQTFGMEIVLNRRLAPTQLMKFHFVEMESDGEEEEPGLQEFLRNTAMSGDATEEEIEFLRSLRFKHNRPRALYYYRELQNLRDPLHFRESSVAPMQKRREARGIERQIQLDSRKKAIQRWDKNRGNARKE